MVSYNKTLVTVSLVFLFIIGVLEYVIGSYLSQHLLEAWGLVFGDNKIDSELDVQLSIAGGCFAVFAVAFLGASLVLVKGVRGVKRDEEERWQRGKFQNEVIDCLNAITEAVNNSNNRKTSNFASKINGQSDD